ncbi:MAG: AAA family ATPase, partial [Chloroflexi bacterium]|nr:AAA family ATPase [Chloroflexota bacterium]
MLSRLVIQNFRSIKHLDIPLGPINMFVGPNNAGKTNILEALNLVLGESFPSARSFDDRD